MTALKNCLNSKKGVPSRPVNQVKFSSGHLKAIVKVPLINSVDYQFANVGWLFILFFVNECVGMEKKELGGVFVALFQGDNVKKPSFAS